MLQIFFCQSKNDKYDSQTVLKLKYAPQTHLSIKNQINMMDKSNY
jgi:hypothetical protein